MPEIEVSPGELVDRITILRVKAKFLKSTPQHSLVSGELEKLLRIAEPFLRLKSVAEAVAALEAVNTEMWVAMERIYQWSEEQDEEYTRTVTHIIEVNRERAFLKRAVDEATGNSPGEAKSFF